MENSRLREAAPTSVNVTVGKRSREYLTDREVERLIEASPSPIHSLHFLRELLAPVGILSAAVQLVHVGDGAPRFLRSRARWRPKSKSSRDRL
jgi:hypothetical protein